MAIYVFSLLVGYEMGGIDTAQGTRHKYLSKLGMPVKYVYGSCPSAKELQNYQKLGIPAESMISIEGVLTNLENYGGSVSKTEKIEELKQNMHIDNVVVSQANRIYSLFEGNKQVADVFTMYNDNAVERIDFYQNKRLAYREWYASRHTHTDYYTEIDGRHIIYRRDCYNEKGEIVLSERFGNNEVVYYLADGRMCSKYEIYEEVFNRLKIGKDDVVIIDRPSWMDFVQPVFNLTEAKIVVFLHSMHDFAPDESPEGVFINTEYYNYFVNADRINSFVVSSEAQRDDLEKNLSDYVQKKARIEVIPVVGLNAKKKPLQKRKPYSILTASRLTATKNIDILIDAVVLAHEINSKINFDIYGSGVEYDNLRQKIEDNHAEDYIHLKGFANLTNIYREYEVYATASSVETFGITLLEAVGSGNAMLGLDTRYGCKIFIHDDVNGFVVDYDINRIKEHGYMDDVVKSFSERIIDMFNDRNRLARFSNKSYELADKFSEGEVAKKWSDFIKDIVAGE